MSGSVSPLAKKKTAGREFSYIPVTRLVTGADLRLGLHVVTGQADGPTLGILSTIHGDETMPLMAVRALLDSLDARSLAGRVAAIPVANPLAVAVFNRQTPEQHGKTDLHEVFPGTAYGNVTQRLASAITTNLLDHVDALIDIHCGGLGGRLQSRVDLDASAPKPVYDESLKLCRAFGTSFVHANNLAGTAARYCNSKSIPTANPEVGGVYLGSAAEVAYMDQIVQGFRSVMSSLNMLEHASKPAEKQLLFTVKSRFEVNPSIGGFLLSYFDSPAHLGKKIEQGTTLGRIVDVHSLEIVEELKATVTGYLFFSRYSGVVDAGTKAFALAEEATSTWLM
jgi:predicted deacylase